MKENETNSWRSLAYGPSLEEIKKAHSKQLPISFKDEISGEDFSVIIKEIKDVDRPHIERHEIFAVRLIDSKDIHMFYTISTRSRGGLYSVE